MSDIILNALEIDGTPSKLNADGCVVGLNAETLTELISYNSFNIFTNPDKTGGEKNGITYSFLGNTVTVSGSTSSVASYYSLYENLNAVPSWIELGKKYYIKFSGSQVSLRIYDSSASKIFETTSDGEFTVPNNLSGCIIRLFVSKNTNNVNEVIKLPAFLLAKSNADIMSDISQLPNPTGVLAEGSDLNSVTSAGVWLINSSWTYDNRPYAENRAAILEVIKTGSGVLVQKLARYDGSLSYFRTSDTYGSFADREWHGTGTENGALPSGTDLNDVTDSGTWLLNSGGETTYSNKPYAENRAAILEVIGTGTKIVVQRLTRYDGSLSYFRTSDTYGSFADREWHGTGTENGALPSGTDLNDVTDSGTWLLNSGGETTYSNKPYAENRAAILEVIGTGTKIVVQRLTRYDGLGCWFRVSDTYGSFADREWHDGAGESNTYNNTYETNVYENEYNITCSPTITTDTNNYLASTGDTTDRTSAIQTMLNNTGICHLGPGVFYVTGVQMPDDSMLIGSGNATQVILASSVNDGCAVALGNSCTVRDIRFMGIASGTRTGSQTVGTRHGILFSATADAEQNATNRKRCFIDGCQFWYFAGGAITCTNTGGRIYSNILVNNCIIYGCDAGINVAYYSEFHRFTNVSVNYCYYGCICNGGNCNFTNCSFSKNIIGILMDNGASQSPNNSHGVFSACTVCHSGDNNDGVAIKILNNRNGEIFQGIQVHFGSIVVDSSRAIRFVGCQFGNAVPFELTDNTLLTFSDCSVYSASTSTVVHTGNTALHFDRCYLYDGTAFDPTA